MESETNQFLFTVIKLGLLGAAWPLWGPFAKALVEELRLAMRIENGFLGAPLTPAERRELEERLDREEPRQVHELLAHHRARATGTPSKRSDPAAPSSGAAAGAGRPKQPALRRTRLR